jgi:hypothetical protein
MGQNTWVAKGIEAVTFLFGMFSGFLTGIAPPEEAGSKFAIGLASFLTLGVILIIWGVLRGGDANAYLRGFLIAAVVLLVIAAVAGITYKWNYDRLTYGYPPEQPRAVGLAGTRLTDEAKAYLQQNKLLTNSELVAKFGGTANRVWTPQSINSAGTWLTVHYIVVVLSLCGMVTCLVEGALGP